MRLYDVSRLSSWRGKYATVTGYRPLLTTSTRQCIYGGGGGGAGGGGDPGERVHGGQNAPHPLFSLLEEKKRCAHASKFTNVSTSYPPQTPSPFFKVLDPPLSNGRSKRTIQTLRSWIRPWLMAVAREQFRPLQWRAEGGR